MGLDISENRILEVSGLSMLPNLANLNISKNLLVDVKSVIHLVSCLALTNLDCSNNELRGEEIIFDVLAKIPQLISLTLINNPFLREIGNSRKKIIWQTKKLVYLDEPIDPVERAIAEAWGVGGHENELKVKKQW